jgi:hypothetical protein
MKLLGRTNQKTIMKKAFTLVEFLVTITIVFCFVGFGYVLVKGGIGDYTAQELFMPEETKAKYQREMVEELRRANDLKEKENQ